MVKYLDVDRESRSLQGLLGVHAWRTAVAPLFFFFFFNRGLVCFALVSGGDPAGCVR